MPSKWRPSPLNCLYVIPDIHGQLDQLKCICKSILPLRKSDGGKDKLVLLGDYIDRGPKTPELIDFLIEAKKKYKDNLILLSGNHEQMLLDAIKPSPTSNKYIFWMNNGGIQTLSSYLDRANQHLDNPFELVRSRVKDFIPKEHIDFFNSLLPYYETEDYIFVHAGCDPTAPLNKQPLEELVWDNGLFNLVKAQSGQNLPWEKTVVTGHHGLPSGEPYISEKFMMLDCSYGKKLLCVELNSMEAFVAGRNKLALVKYDLVSQ
jgi:serine/threonine protein phosphatase 1